MIESLNKFKLSSHFDMLLTTTTVIKLSLLQILHFCKEWIYVIKYGIDFWLLQKWWQAKIQWLLLLKSTNQYSPLFRERRLVLFKLKLFKEEGYFSEIISISFVIWLPIYWKFRSIWRLFLDNKSALLVVTVAFALKYRYNLLVTVTINSYWYHHLCHFEHHTTKKLSVTHVYLDEIVS